MKFPIHLDELQLQYQFIDDLSSENVRKEDKVQYEPEVFPGLVYRMKNPKVTFLIFVSGKIVITGAKNEKTIHDSFEKIYRVVEEFRKGRKSHD